MVIHGLWDAAIYRPQASYSVQPEPAVSTSAVILETHNDPIHSEAECLGAEITRMCSCIYAAEARLLDLIRLFDDQVLCCDYPCVGGIPFSPSISWNSSIRASAKNNYTTLLVFWSVCRVITVGTYLLICTGGHALQTNQNPAQSCGIISCRGPNRKA